MKSSLDGAHYSGLHPRGFLAPAHDSDINVDCIVLRDCACTPQKGVSATNTIKNIMTREFAGRLPTDAKA
jgi:hypothetical protein